MIKNGVTVAIIGKPNAGKSTLLNRLLNEDRAIVSEIAGTTRDTIEETLNIQGILFRLIDTAGIRNHSTDTIENIGIERSREKMKSADLVLYIFDGSVETPENLQQQVKEFELLDIKYLLVSNKADLGIKDYGIDGVLSISAKQDEGIVRLTKRLYDSFVQQGDHADTGIVTNARHLEALVAIARSLKDIRNGLDQQISGDLLAADIRQSLYYLGEITGEVTNEDKLDYIFSKFCIGK